jgi:HEAT repeat protein
VKGSLVVSLVVLGVLVVGGALAWAAAVGHAKREEETSHAWRDVASALGLEFSEYTDNRTLAGQLDGVPVRAEYSYVVHGEANTRTYVEKMLFSAGGQIPVSLVARKDSTVFGVSDPEIGDKSFDDRVELANVNAYVCAALTYSARTQLLALLEAGGEVRQGKIVRETGGDATATRSELMETLRSFAKLARLLEVTDGTLHERLAANATSDPISGVRLQNLRCLVDPATHAPAALVTSTARSLLADERTSLRLLAARQLGREGGPVLRAIAASEPTRAPLRVEALGALHEQSAPELHGLLSPLLASSTPEVVCAALSIVAARGLDELSADVMLCTESEHPTVRAAAATTLAALSPELAEATLLALLADASTDVQRACVEALGRVGSVAAVEPLLPLARAFVPSPLRHAARDAVARIQSRLAPVGAGALTLVPDDDRAGAVTVAEASAHDAGAISLAEPAVPEAEAGSPELRRRH